MKCDIKSAYRLLSDRPPDRHLLGIQWQGYYFFDKTLTMGLASACNIFKSFRFAIKYILLQFLLNVYIIKILDEFLIVTSSYYVCLDAIYHLLLALFKRMAYH